MADRMRNLAVTALLLLSLQQVVAQIGANAALDPAVVETGDTFTLRVLVSGIRAQPVSVDFQPWEHLFSAENILRQYPWQMSGSQWVQRFTLIAMDSARVLLPPLVVRLNGKDSLQTNSLQLEVRPTPVPADLSDLSPLRDIRREPADWTDYWPLALLLVLGLSVGAWYMAKKRPAPQVVVVHSPPPPPAHEAALRALEGLKTEAPWKSGREMAYYEALSRILLEYLEQQYAIPALESTTRETMQLLKHTDFPASQMKPLGQVLARVDLVKYANILPAAEQHERALETAFSIIQSILVLSTPGYEGGETESANK